MTAFKFVAGSKRYQEDAVHLFILLCIAFLLGVYLIATTVLIAQDGIFYIERAQKLASDPRSVVMSHPPGYPFLIFIALKFVDIFSSNVSAQTLAYAAQCMTLLCRLLSIIPLYFIGKYFVGPRNSFWALLILIFLPYPASFGSDVLRDWPHILFLAVGFLILLWGVERGKWWFFGITGIVAGLGYIIRPECIQLLLYGILWIGIKLLKPNFNMSRVSLVFTLFILLIGFALPITPYALEKGKVIPVKLMQLVDSSEEPTVSSLPARSEQQIKLENHKLIYRIMNLISSFPIAMGRLVGEISDNLMYYFLPALLIGIFCRFRKESSAMAVERIFMPVFIILNVVLMILLHYSQGYISRRHCLPLVVFSIFYVPIGLRVFADWLGIRPEKDCLDNKQKTQLWFYILVAIGVTICLPKLLRPLRIEKKGYRDAANWLKENTSVEDVISVPDYRISFYAERDRSTNENIPGEIDYIVRLVKDDDEKPEIDGSLKERLSFWVDKRREKNRLIIYQVL